jgi:hypothetical protein
MLRQGDLELLRDPAPEVAYAVEREEFELGHARLSRHRDLEAAHPSGVRHGAPPAIGRLANAAGSAARCDGWMERVNACLGLRSACLAEVEDVGTTPGSMFPLSGWRGSPIASTGLRHRTDGP